MSDTNHAILESLDGRSALRFERVLAHPPERVWRALCTTRELSDWHPTPFELEPEVGGLVRFLSTPGAPEIPDGRVLDYDPPRLLRYTWGEDELRWELRPHDDGSVLALTHSFDDRFKAARDAAGWHLCLDALSSSLESEPHPQRGHGEQLPTDWSALNNEYERRFEIPHEQATRPPSM